MLLSVDPACAACMQRTHCAGLALFTVPPAAGTLGNKSQHPSIHTTSQAVLFQGGDVINYLPSRAFCEKLKKKRSATHSCPLVPPKLINSQHCWNFQVCPGPSISEARDTHYCCVVPVTNKRRVVTSLPVQWGMFGAAGEVGKPKRILGCRDTGVPLGRVEREGSWCMFVPWATLSIHQKVLGCLFQAKELYLEEGKKKNLSRP